MTREKYCYGCDTTFVIKTASKEPVKFCPFCCEDLSEGEEAELDEFSSEDF